MNKKTTSSTTMLSAELTRSITSLFVNFPNISTKYKFELRCAAIASLSIRLGLRNFKNTELLLNAFFHTSFIHEIASDCSNISSNERMEFLGDAILEAYVSDYLFKLYPKFSEGDLSKKRSAMVRETALVELSRVLGLANCVFLGKGQDAAGGSKLSSIIANSFEALLAAFYLDQGHEGAYQFLDRVFQIYKSEEGREFIDSDIVCQRKYKDELNQLFLKKFKYVPVFEYVKLPNGEYKAIIECVGKQFEGASAVSKKLAAESVAKIIFQKDILKNIEERSNNVN